MKRAFVGALVFAAAVCAFAQNANPEVFRNEVDYPVANAIDVVGNRYIQAWSLVPSVMSVVNEDGSVSVCTANRGEKETWVYDYSKEMVLTGGRKFPNEFDMLGAFAKDREGNYYFFYGRRVGANERGKENMALVKYDPSGEKLLTYKLKAGAPNSFHGIRIPFEAATCRLEVSGQMIAVYFGREMFGGHQASYGFVLDKDSFQRVDKGAGMNERSGGSLIMPYVSHSFNQFILPVGDGFVFADHGDAYPRCFAFAQFLGGGGTKRLEAFKFTGSRGQNGTFAQMGGLAKTGAGFLFAGTYGGGAGNPRNLFVFSFDDNFTSCGKPLYLTKYTKAEGHVANPKITGLEAGRFLLMWEQCEFTTQSPNVIASGPTGYKTTYMLIIDEEGKPLSEITELPGIRLNMNDVLRYNRATGKVYWSINEDAARTTYDGGTVTLELTVGDKDALVTYALDPDKPVAAKP